MSLRRRKQKAPDIVSSIPFDEKESVNLITVSKQKRRIAVSSADISVPITQEFHAGESSKSVPPSSAAECDDGEYSDAEGAATSAGQKADRKGPSRSASVRLFLPPRGSIHWGRGVNYPAGTW